MFTKCTTALRNFDRDEDGLEAVQVVMIVAIAAVILIGMMKFGNAIFEWAKTSFDGVKNADIETTF